MENECVRVHLCHICECHYYGFSENDERHVLLNFEFCKLNRTLVFKMKLYRICLKYFYQLSEINVIYH